MTKIKICGITNLKDALVAVEAGADLLGFIFYEPSPRYITPEAVKEIVSGVRGRVSGDGGRETRGGDYRVAVGSRRSAVGFVGVFVNTPLETVAQILDFCQLDAAQLHGEESPEFVSHFGGRAFKAIRPQSQEEAERLIQKYLTCSPAPLLPCLLLDAYHPHLYGGTGHVTDWALAASIARRYPIMLAGSLTPANVAEAIRVVQPWGVDVSSGVEAEKGKKDHDKVRRFVEVVRLIDRVLPRTEVQG
ncbi:MAG TPA: phosphoribosylanthranilate isomerase [Anaerolineae bacterium]|nr:phosphoribosylanthranilate isomerase [Anaerolineae bacterium]